MEIIEEKVVIVTDQSESNKIEGLDNSGFSFLSVSTTVSTSKGIRHLNPNKEVDKNTFDANFNYWKADSCHRSVNNFDNACFDEIVAMGDAAVPHIKRILEQGPSPIVHALDRIYPGVVNYNGLTSIQEACDIWLELLKML